MVDVELPEEILDALNSQEVTRPDHLAALEQTLLEKRLNAINHRKEIGIEETWTKAEEAYLGVDDANRAMFVNARWAKPMTMSGPLQITSTPGQPGETKSTAYVRMTSRYVDVASAKVAQILLPANGKAFGFTATPVPDIQEALKDDTQVVEDGVPLMRDARPEEIAQSGAAAGPQGMPSPASPAGSDPAATGPQQVPLRRKDVAQDLLDQANQKAKKAETRIYDWMVEAKYRKEGRKVIFDMAKLGTGIFKGPFPEKRTAMRLSKDKNGIEILQEIKPGYKAVSPWNLYPSDDCGEDVNKGSYVFEYDGFSRKQLNKLKDQPGYIKSRIDRVLQEGPRGYDDTSRRVTQDEKVRKKQYPIWYFYGVISKEEYLAARGASGKVESGDGLQGQVHVICTMANDTIIKAVINPLESGEFPYHVCPWMRRPDYWAGVGVAEQLEMPQRAINGAVRSMFNNAGKSAGSILVFDDECIEPADGSYVLHPDKVFRKRAGATMDDVRKAFFAFEVPSRTKELLLIIDFALRQAEEATSIPLVTQGQSGTTTPETYGATQLQNNNANQLLRDIGFQFDDYITEPLVNQSYEYLLLDPDVPDDEKGDWKIDAHGSSALVERAIQDETIRQMSQMALNPAFGVDPKRWFAAFSRANHLDPKEFQYTEEEQRVRDQTPPPPPYQVQVAQIRSQDNQRAIQAELQAEQMRTQAAQAVQQIADEAKLQIAGMRKEVDTLRVQKDTDRDTVYANAERQRVEAEHDARMKELAMKRELEMLKYANLHSLQLEQVKADLAKTEMTLKVQKELAHVKAVASGGAEPPGKAPNGEGFTQ